MQFSDDRGERIADTGHFSQAVFRNPSIKRLCQGFEALRRPYIGTGAERVCFGQRDPPQARIGFGPGRQALPRHPPE